MRRLLPGLLLIANPAHGEVIDILQGTNMTVAVDPSGARMVVDLLGGLWELPTTGGGATALIAAGSGIAQPRFDASGERIVVQRWLDGQWDLWMLTLADGSWTALTETGSINEREPEFGTGGDTVVFAGDRTGRYTIWSLDLTDNGLRQLTDEPGDARFPSVASDGTLAYVVHRDGQSSINVYSGEPRGTPLIRSRGRLTAPSWRPGGRVVLFSEQLEASTNLRFFIDADEPILRSLTAGEDVFIGRAAWLSPAEYVYAADGQLWRRGIASTERTPVHLFAATNVDTIRATSAAAQLDLTGPRRVTGIGSADWNESTGWAFSALGDLWVLGDDEPRRLTDDPFTDAWPAFLPDGQTLLFASDRAGDRAGNVDLWQMRVETGQALRLTDEPGHVFSPKLSADGTHVAYLTSDSALPSEAAALKLLEIGRPYQSTTLAAGLRDTAGLTWDGSDLRLIARTASDAVPVPKIFATGVDAPSQPEPRARTDAPPLPADRLPTWRPQSPDTPYVIRARRLFDGIGNEYRYQIDIHVEGQRITDVVRRDRRPLPERIVDAENLTVIPGLIDVHAHQSTLPGSAVGPLWLAHGITTVREVVTDTGEALERAEAWASGRQLGPRLIVAPDAAAGRSSLASAPIAVGGGRIGWNLAHAIDEQRRRDDFALPGLPPTLRQNRSASLPRLELSPQGRSYQDVIAGLDASGTYLATGLAALSATAGGFEIDGLTETLQRVMRSSGRIAIGSEAPAVPHGAGFHDELELLVAQGIPEAQVLRWATAGGALALGLSLQVGTIEPGRLADLVLIDGDPLTDIGEVERVRAVVKGGIWIDVDQLARQ